MNPLLRLALELGPLAVFFIGNARFDIFVATALFMAAVAVALAANYALERRLPTMPLVSAAIVLIFGGLTLILEDALFIKLKPTIVNLLFAGTLFVGLAMQRNLIKLAMGHAIDLRDEGWRKLSWRWAWFFVFLAGLNELVWRTQSTDFWVSFKVFGIMPITLLFAVSMLPLIRTYMILEPETESAGGGAKAGRKRWAKRLHKQNAGRPIYVPGSRTPGSRTPGSRTLGARGRPRSAKGGKG